MKRLLLPILMLGLAANMQAGLIKKNDRDNDRDNKKNNNVVELLKKNKDQDKNKKSNNDFRLGDKLDKILKGGWNDLFDKYDDCKDWDDRWCPPRDCDKVPDGGTTALLLGVGLVGVGLIRRRKQ